MVLIVCCISSGCDLCKFITFEKGTVLGLQSFFSFFFFSLKSTPVPGMSLLPDGKKVGYGARLQVEMPTPKSIRSGSGGRIPRLFFLPIEITNHFLFWTKKKKSFGPGASPSPPVAGAQPSPPHGLPGPAPHSGAAARPEGPRGRVTVEGQLGRRCGGAGMWSEQLWHVPRPRVFLSNPVNTSALILECPPLVLSVGVSSSFPPPAIPSTEFYVFFFFLGSLCFSNRNDQNGFSLHELKLFVFPE